MKLKKAKQTYRFLQVAAILLAVLAFFARQKMYPPTTEAALREVKIWSIVFIVSLIILAVLIVLLTYFKAKVKNNIQESEILEQGTKYIFEEGENDGQEK